MIEQNPYESKGENEIPSFVKKDDVDLSVLKLNEEEYEEEPQEEQPKPKRKLNLNNLMMLAGALCLVLIVFLIFLSISKTNQYKSLESAYNTYVATTDAKIERLEKEVESLKAENEELKKNAVTPADNSGQSQGNSQTGTLTTGKYVMAYDLNLRTGPGTNYDKCDYNKLPEDIKREAYDNGVLSSGTEIDVQEIRQNGDQVWGRIADNVWICIKSGNTTYVKK